MRAIEPATKNLDSIPIGSHTALDDEARKIVRRKLRHGLAIFGVVVLAGIPPMVRYHHSEGLRLTVMHSALHVFLLATFGPLELGLFMLPITLPVLLVSGTLIYFGLSRKRLWLLSIVGLVQICVYWLWLIKLINDGVWVD